MNPFRPKPADVTVTRWHWRCTTCGATGTIDLPAHYRPDAIAVRALDQHGQPDHHLDITRDPSVLD